MKTTKASLSRMARNTSCSKIHLGFIYNYYQNNDKGHSLLFSIGATFVVCLCYFTLKVPTGMVVAEMILM